MKEESMRLNPFVYISETDVRFYLVVIIGIIIPSVGALSWGFRFLNVTSKTILILFNLVSRSLSEYWFFSVHYPITGLRDSLFLGALSFCIIPFLVWWNYTRFPKKIIKESKLEEFDKERFPDHLQYIESLYRKYVGLVKQPTLMYQPRDPLNPSESASTFGTKNHLYVSIPAGLIRKFRRSIEGFKSIFLHEMGHVVNGDVKKAYLAEATWRALRLAFLIPFVLLILDILSSVLGVFVFSGYDVGYTMSVAIEAGAVEGVISLGRIAAHFLTFLVIIYLLRKQIIRLREFYADAKVLDWEGSSKNIVKTLEGFKGELHSKFELLTKFHPNINERIQVLKNNLALFTPSLWIVFVFGFSYNVVEYQMPPIAGRLLSIETTTDLQSAYIATLISFFLAPIVLFAVSSIFHRLLLKDIFVENERYLTTIILNSLKFSSAFSLGWATQLVIYDIISYFPSEELLIRINVTVLYSIFHVIYFSTVMIFLSTFASMLIRRSFSKKKAERYFLMITVLSSTLYVIILFAANVVGDLLLVIVLSLIFSVVTYIFIKKEDRKLRCPNCNNKISNLSGLKLYCPNCHHNLYSWAVHSFSENSVS